MNNLDKKEIITNYYLNKIAENTKQLQRYNASLFLLSFLLLIVYIGFVQDYSFGFDDRIYLIIGVSVITSLVLILIVIFCVANIVSLKKLNAHFDEQIILMSLENDMNTK